MSDYTKTTNFAAKDSLPSGNSGKIVKGSEIDTEFTNIQTAVATKLDINNSALTGTTTAQTLDISGNVTAAALTVDTTTLVVDASNNRVGIGESSPATDLHITNSGATQLLLESGTSSQGILLFGDADDLNVGSVMYDHSDNSMRFETSDTERFRIDSSGNVGIGTASPSGELHVLSSANGDVYVERSSGAQLHLQAQSANGKIGTSSNHNLGLNTNGTTRVTIDTSGNVGIGVTSMSHPLVIQNATPIIQLIDSNASTRVANIGGENGNVTIDVDPNQAEGTSFFSVDIDNTERFRIDASGNVGIGTSSPQTLLHLSSTSPVLSFTDTNSFTDPNDRFIVRGVGNRGAIQWYDDSASSTKEIMSFSPDGNVGIGVTNPLMNLHLSDTGDTGIQITKDGSVASRIKTVSGALAIGVDGANGDTERMRIDSSGNLALGTTSVTNALGWASVAQVGGANPALSLKNTSNVQWDIANFGGTFAVYNGSNQRLTIDSSGNVTVKAAGELRIRDDGSFIKEDQGLQIGNTSGTGTTRPIRFFTESAERMRIDSSGKVGIGTGSDTPTALLEVEAASNPEISIASSAGATSNFLNFKAISHSQQIQTQLKTIDNGNYTADLAFLFKASGTSGALAEQARLAANGTFLIGCTGQTGDAPNSDGFLFEQIGNLKIRVNSDGQVCQQYYSPTGGTSGPVGSITVNASSTAFNTSSDQRLKENIADADDAGSKVDAIQVRQFDWIANGSHQDYGMVAQELQSVAPEAVSGDADSDEMMAVDYSKLVPMLVKEIQSLRNRVAQLENN